MQNDHYPSIALFREAVLFIYLASAVFYEAFSTKYFLSYLEQLQ